MKKTLMSLVAAGAIAASGAGSALAGDTITGAGATFPYPVYSKWASDYNAKTGVKLNYQSIGSGGGIKQIKAKTVDFGASDAPLKPDQLKEAGLVQFPMIMGGVVPVVNVKGIGAGELKLTGAALADIYLGKITQWNDKALKTLNPGLSLPSKAITVVERADGSGTTWIFTNYLSKISPDWEKNVGNNKSVSWPVGVGGKGNEGVAAFVNKVDGAIGYVEYAYALQNKMANVLLQNREGTFVAPTAETFQAAAAGADWSHAEGYYLVLTDQPGKEAWPITGASFILMHSRQANPGQAREVLKFFDWAYANGMQSALKLDYVPMPDKVASMVRKTWTDSLAGEKGDKVWPAN